jgi:hypothetical protein
MFIIFNNKNVILTSDVCMNSQHSNFHISGHTVMSVTTQSGHYKRFNIFTLIYSDLHYTVVMAVKLIHVQSLAEWRGSGRVPKTSEKTLSRHTIYHDHNKSEQPGSTAYNYKSNNGYNRPAKTRLDRILV